MARLDFGSLLREETIFRWQFLNDEPDPCAVVTDRMELLYLNDLCQTLVPHQWFAKRCFEVLPNSEALCAMDCPTIRAVHASEEVVYAEERLEFDDGQRVNLGTAIIPLRQSIDDSAKAILLFRARDADGGQGAFEARLLSDAHQLGQRAIAATA